MKKTAFFSSPGKMALILICLFTFPWLNAFSQTIGDVNADGFVNHADLILVKDHILNRNVLDGDALTSADVNLDAKVDVADMVMIDILTTFSIPMVYVPSGTLTIGRAG